LNKQAQEWPTSQIRRATFLTVLPQRAHTHGHTWTSPYEHCPISSSLTHVPSLS